MDTRIALAALALSVSVAMLPIQAVASDDDDEEGSQLVCYVWDIFPNERFKLGVGEHSALSERKEEENFGHARQTAFSVHGKQVGSCGDDSMVTVKGTVITAKATRRTTGQVGAHMGIETNVARANDSCRSLIVECTTTEVSATPATWSCFSRNEFGAFHGPSLLTRVDKTRDPRCSIFEDGFDLLAAPAAVAVPRGRASGLRP